jgi:hypothetical protein
LGEDHGQYGEQTGAEDERRRVGGAEAAGSDGAHGHGAHATGATTTLGAVLDAASSSATPAGCVASVTPSSGTGTITALNGETNSGITTWKSSIDGATAVAASRGTTVHLGDTLYLRYGSSQSSEAGPYPSRPSGPFLCD